MSQPERLIAALQKMSSLSFYQTLFCGSQSSSNHSTRVLDMQEIRKHGILFYQEDVLKTCSEIGEALLILKSQLKPVLSQRSEPNTPQVPAPKTSDSSQVSTDFEKILHELSVIKENIRNIGCLLDL